MDAFDIMPASDLKLPVRIGQPVRSHTMSTIKLSIPRNYLCAVSLFAAIKDVRFYLNAVCLEIGAKESRLIATNGHVCAVMKFEAEVEGFVSPKQFIIPLEQAKKIRIAGKGHVGPINIVIEPVNEPSPEQFASLADGDSVTRFKLIDAKFPDYRRIFPKSIDTPETAQFDPGYLMLFQKAAKILGKVDSVTPYVIHNGGSIASVSIGHDDFAGVIMPVRAAGRTDLPRWVFD